MNKNLGMNRPMSGLEHNGLKYSNRTLLPVGLINLRINWESLLALIIAVSRVIRSTGIFYLAYS